MKMTKCLSVIALLSLMSLSGPCFAANEGSGKGNGGGIHLCFDENNELKKPIELYDLYEGRKIPTVSDKQTRRKLTIPKWDGLESKEEVSKRILKKIAIQRPELAKIIAETLELFKRDDFVMSAHDIELSKVPDANELLVGKGCRYQQLANWVEKDVEYLLRDEQYYDQLDPLNQAATDFHEAVFKVVRFYANKMKINLTDSSTIRRFIAEAFSDSDIVNYPMPKEATELVADYDHNHFSVFIPRSCKFTESKFSIGMMLTEFSDLNSLTVTTDSNFFLTKDERQSKTLVKGKSINYMIDMVQDRLFYLFFEDSRWFTWNKVKRSAISAEIEFCGYKKLSMLVTSKKIQRHSPYHKTIEIKFNVSPFISYQMHLQKIKGQ